MSFLSIYLTISVILIILVNSIISINLNLENTADLGFVEAPKGPTNLYGYACAVMFGCAVLLTSSLALCCKKGPFVEFYNAELYTNSINTTYVYLLLNVTALIILVVSKPALLYENAVLMAFSLLGLILMIESSNLIGLYLGLELYSLSAYILAGGGSFFSVTGSSAKTEKGPHSVNSVSAGVSYFLLSALSSGVFVAGIGLIYACTGEMTLNGLARMALFFGVEKGAGSAANEKELSFSGEGFVDPSFLLFTVGVVFVISTLIFKLGSAPFHFWVPYVYSKVPLTTTFYFIVIPKVAIIIALLRISSVFSFFGLTHNLILLCAVSSLVVGALGGLVQTKITRLLAFSSISHVGYILLALYGNLILESPHFSNLFIEFSDFAKSAPLSGAAAVPLESYLSTYSIYLYLGIYAIMTINFFTIYGIFINNVVTTAPSLEKNDHPNSALFSSRSGSMSPKTLLKNPTKSPHYINSLVFLLKTHPYLAASLAITTLSMAGVPPFAGFFAKATIYFSVLDSGMPFLALFAVICSVVTAFYYLTFIKVTYFYENSPVVSLVAQKNNTSVSVQNPHLLDGPSSTISTFSALTIAFSTVIIVLYPLLSPNTSFFLGFF